MKNTLIEAVAVLAFLLFSLSSCNSGPGRYQLITAQADTPRLIYILDTHTGVYYIHFTKEIGTFNPISGEYTSRVWKKADKE